MAIAFEYVDTNNELASIANNLWSMNKHLNDMDMCKDDHMKARIRLWFVSSRNFVCFFFWKNTAYFFRTGFIARFEFFFLFFIGTCKFLAITEYHLTVAMTTHAKTLFAWRTWTWMTRQWTWMLTAIGTIFRAHFFTLNTLSSWLNSNSFFLNWNLIKQSWRLR